jgi:hypothetical protein
MEKGRGEWVKKVEITDDNSHLYRVRIKTEVDLIGSFMCRLPYLSKFGDIIC